MWPTTPTLTSRLGCFDEEVWFVDGCAATISRDFPRDGLMLRRYIALRHYHSLALVHHSNNFELPTIKYAPEPRSLHCAPEASQLHTEIC